MFTLVLQCLLTGFVVLLSTKMKKLYNKNCILVRFSAATSHDQGPSPLFRSRHVTEGSLFRTVIESFPFELHF